MADKTPKWVTRHVQKCRDAFGIGHAGFNFYLYLADQIGDSPDVGGQADTSARYIRAEVTLRRPLLEEDATYETLTHEVLHAATGAQRQAVSQIIGLLPEALRDHAESLWQDGNEATVTQLARALTPLLRAVKRGKA